MIVTAPFLSLINQPSPGGINNLPTSIVNEPSVEMFNRWYGTTRITLHPQGNSKLQTPGTWNPNFKPLNWIGKPEILVFACCGKRLFSCLFSCFLHTKGWMKCRRRLISELSSRGYSVWIDLPGFVLFYPLSCVSTKKKKKQLLFM